MLGLERELIAIKSDIVFSVFGFHIANSTLLIFLIMGIILFFSLFISKNIKMVPSNLQLSVEILYVEFMNFVKQLMNNHPHAEKIFPIIIAVLIYFVISNIIIFIPGLSSFTYSHGEHHMEIFRAPTSDFNTIIGVAFAAIAAINLIAIKEQGLLPYLGEFFKFKEVFQGFRKSIADGFTSLIEFLVGLLDIIGELAKIMSLSFRLFGNIYAGEVLAIVIMGSLAYVLPAAWTLVSGFIGILQGVVFASLVAVYYSLSVKVKETE